jgi:hypothetical protein
MGGSLIRVERYVIEQTADAVVLRMRQSPNALGVAALSCGVLLLSWWFGPYGPHPTEFGGFFYWIWSLFWGIVVLLALGGACQREDWTITREETVVIRSFGGGWRSVQRVPRTRTLGVRVELRQETEEGRIFPWRLHFLDDTGDTSGLSVLLQRRGSVHRFLEALRAVVPLDVDDTSRHRSTG